MTNNCLVIAMAGIVIGGARPGLAAPLIPPQYRGGIDLISQGGTVTRAMAYSKGIVYASVDAETCYPNQPASAATVYTVDVRNPASLQYLTKGTRCSVSMTGRP